MRVLKGVELRRNYALNPSLEVDTSDWVANAATISRVTAEFHHGVAALSTVTNGTSGSGCYKDAKALAGSGWAAGDPCSSSLWVKAPSGAALLASLVTLGGATGSPLVSFTGTGAWQQITLVNGVVPAGATSVPYVYIRANGAHTAFTFYVDEVLIEKASTPGAFFTGSTANTETRVYEWAGTANASASIEYERIPNLVAEALTEGPWAGVTVQGLEAGDQVLTLWRTAGGERLPVRGGRDLEAVDSAYVIDYEVPLGQLVTYELEVTAGSDAGAVVAPATVTVASSCGYIHDPLDPTLPVPVWASRAPSGEAVLSGTAFKQLTHEAEASVHRIVGSRLPVVIGGARQGPSEVDLSMLTDAEAQNTRLRDMVENTSLLVVRGLPGWIADAWPPVAYVSAPVVVEYPLTAHLQNGTGRFLTRWEVVGRRVRGSAASVLISLFTYDDVAALFDTYDQKQAAAGGGTYLEDLKNPLNA